MSCEQRPSHAGVLEGQVQDWGTVTTEYRLHSQSLKLHHPQPYEASCLELKVGQLCDS